MRLLFTLFYRHAKQYPWLYGRFAVLLALVVGMWVLDPLWTRFAIDTLMSAKEGNAVDYRFIFGTWAGIFVLHTLIQTANKFTAWRVANHLILDRQREIYERVLYLGVAFHTKQKSGEVVKILDEGADTLVDLQRTILVQLIPSLLTALAFLVAGFLLNPFLASILLFGLVLYIGIAVIGTRKTYALQNKVNKLWVQTTGRAYDAVTNIHAVKSGAQEPRELMRMKEVQSRTYDAQQAVNRRWAVVEGINFFYLTRILLVGIGIYLYTQDVLSLGEVYFFQMSFYRVLTPFEMLGDLLPQWNKHMGRIRLSEQLLQTPVDVQNVPEPVTPTTLKGAITFDRVSFSYAPEPVLSTEEKEEEITDIHARKNSEETTESKEMEEKVDTGTITVSPQQPYPDEEDQKPGEVLHEITLDIKPGEHIAFVGHSGAGKTTIAMLLNRFYDVTGGRILVDGTDLRELDVHWWRSQIGLVLQENIMFNDTLLENIRYARPDATEEEVKEAAERAAAAEFIEKLPNGYRTIIGERGIRLSGGQRQRVAIARAILKQPKIVVLDEATSALDSVTEKRVQDGIKNLIAGKTACIIAHRLSTVRSVDRIAVFDKGRLVDVAPHEELLKRCAIYREMVELQSQGMLMEE